MKDNNALPFDLMTLTEWMDGQGLGDGPLSELQRLSGGTQNILISYKRDNKTYILRRPPLHLRKNSNETMRREAQMLNALKETDVPHPHLIAACTDASVLGTSFYLMEAVVGFNATLSLPRLHANSAFIRRNMGLAMVTAIAKLASIDYKTVHLHDFGKPDGYLERQVPRWLHQLNSYKTFEHWPGADDIPGIYDVARWLTEKKPQDFQAGIIHGDYHLANVMFNYENAELAAIVDWELTTIGDPLLDLGWLIATWPDSSHSGTVNSSVKPWHGFPNANELIEHYGQCSTRDLSQINWYSVLACFKLGIILESTYARACDGKASMETGKKLHQSTLKLFNRARELMR